MRFRTAVLTVVAAAGMTLPVAPANAAPHVELEPGIVLVLYKESASNEQRAATTQAVGQRMGVAVTSEGEDRLQSGVMGTVRVPAGKEREAVSAFEDRPVVVAAEPNRVYYGLLAHDECPSASSSCYVPRDGDFRKQWHLQNDGQTLQPSGGGAAAHDADVDAPSAWTGGLGSSQTRIAVLDTGVDLNHPDLVGRIVGTQDFTGSRTVAGFNAGHGTHVAGIAAAAGGDDGTGVIGVAPRASLLIGRIFKWDKRSGQSVTTDRWITDSIDWAITQDADMINMSFSGTTYNEIHNRLLLTARNSNVLPVAAAGNEGSSTRSYPAAYEHVVGVASITNSDKIAATSNRGLDWVDIAAPGDSIWSTLPTFSNDIGGTNYGYLSGTSMASPVVAGTAALAWSQMPPGATDNDLEDRLYATADPIPGTGEHWSRGAINAGQAVHGVPSSNYKEAVTSTPGLVAYWRLGEAVGATTAVDETGRHNGFYDDGGIVTGIGGLTWGVQGGVRFDRDTAVHFHAGVTADNSVSGGEVRIPFDEASPDGLMPGDSFSLEFVVKPRRTGTTEMIWEARGTHAVSVSVSGCKANLMSRGNDGWNVLLASSSLNLCDSNWHHVIVTKDGSERRIYTDGQDTTQMGQNVTIPQSYAFVEFGGVYGDFLEAPLDEISFYSRGLTSSEAMKHYRSVGTNGRG